MILVHCQAYVQMICEQNCAGAELAKLISCGALLG